MRCIVCGGHADWEQTVFKGTSPTRVRLCEPCQTKVQADEQIARIKAAADHDAKTAAVDEFLKDLGVNP
jgi:hypothetical protein